MGRATVRVRIDRDLFETGLFIDMVACTVAQRGKRSYERREGYGWLDCFGPMSVF